MFNLKVVLFSTLLFSTTVFATQSQEDAVTGRTYADLGYEVFHTLYPDIKTWFGGSYKERNITARSEAGRNDSYESMPSWCNSARTPTEYFICGKSAIWQYENENHRRYRMLYPTGSKADKANAPELNAWMALRKKVCRPRSPSDCLKLYQLRIQSLSNRQRLLTQGLANRLIPSGVRPSWCSNTFKRPSEPIVCKYSALWRYDNQVRTIRDSYKSIENKSHKRWLGYRDRECQRSINHCIKAYDERIHQLVYETTFIGKG